MFLKAASLVDEGSESAMLVGHNPAITDFVNAMTNADIENVDNTENLEPTYEIFLNCCIPFVCCLLPDYIRLRHLIIHGFIIFYILVSVLSLYACSTIDDDGYDDRNICYIMTSVGIITYGAMYIAFIIVIGTFIILINSRAGVGN